MQNKFLKTIDIINRLNLKNSFTFLETINKDLSIQTLLNLFSEKKIPEYIAYIAKIELIKFTLENNKNYKTKKSYKQYSINPTLNIVNSPYKIYDILKSKNPSKEILISPIKQDEYILLYNNFNHNKFISIKLATNEELLALKILSDKIAKKSIDKSKVELILKKASLNGIIISPNTLLKRSNQYNNKESKEKFNEKFMQAKNFTVQWHITNKCDLHCKHCYDRSKRLDLSLNDAEKVLNKIKNFTLNKKVNGHICLSGGNPFLFNNFIKLYKIICNNQFSTSFLGNPVSLEKLLQVNAIQKPQYFQVSLEGLKEHNDFIRGEGNFHNVINFLKNLKLAKISSAVMLTLTNDNIDQVLPLAEYLQDKTDYFTFNRLSPTGEGAKLKLPDTVKYKNFLYEYIMASKKNKILGFKDNLINITLENENINLFSGCTGFGCGAAFNFVAILPDGEVHACRKFQSKIGNIYTDNLLTIYNSTKAKKFRERPLECISCSLMRICGGCLAISTNLNNNNFKTKDPYCFR